VVSQECNYFIAPDGSIWDSTAVYEYVFTAADGCDSIVTFDLTVDTVDNRATQNGIVLSALAANATFQWIDCSDSTEISGATNSTYVVSANGSYAVKVTQDSCEQWSECFTVDNIGLDEYSTNAYNLYPNPSNGHLFISPAPENGTEVILYSVTGTKVGTYDVQGGQVMLAPEVPSGSYLVVNKAINLRQPMIMVR
jgi:hypothetical protein